MILQNWWYTTLLERKYSVCPPLHDKINSDVLIVGGGMGGLSAAYRLMNSGKKVVLLERNICGGSSTGKSAGFLTPDSELELSHLLRRFGKDGASDLWNVATNGAKQIISTIKTHQIECDLQEQPSLFLGLGNSGKNAIHEESEARKQMGFGFKTFDQNEMQLAIGSKEYSSAISYSGTYGINPLQYSQEIKQVLLDNGVKIFESSEVIGIDGNNVLTHLGSVTSDDIIFCADKIQPNISEYSRNIYHAQTFLAISEPLERQDIDKLFPNGQFQCWDSELVYTYFRLTGDNRLLVGGGDIMTTFSKNDTTSSHVINRVIAKLKQRIPVLKHLQFIQYWPGRIDMTRDLLPTILKHPKTNIHFVLGCVGLPWASFCGHLVAEHVLDQKEHDNKYYKYFSANRKFIVPLSLQKILGKKFTFTLSSALSKYKQVSKEDKIEYNDVNW